MLAISLKQPWAQLVVLGAKRVETRSWPTNYRGEIAIHASKSFPGVAKRFAMALTSCVCPDAYLENGVHADSCIAYLYPELSSMDVNTDFTLGAIVGTAEIQSCDPTERAESKGIRPASFERAVGDYSPGRWFWTLANPIMWDKPKPCRGALKIWTVPEQISI